MKRKILKKHGGKRPGAGRKVGSKTANDKLKLPTATISIRHCKIIVDAVKAKYPNRGELNSIGKIWLESLIKQE